MSAYEREGTEERMGGRSQTNAKSRPGEQVLSEQVQAEIDGWWRASPRSASVRPYSAR